MDLTEFAPPKRISPRADPKFSEMLTRTILVAEENPSGDYFHESEVKAKVSEAVTRSIMLLSSRMSDRMREEFNKVLLETVNSLEKKS